MHDINVFFDRGNEINSSEYPADVATFLEVLAYERIGGEVTPEDVFRFIESEELRYFVAAFAYFSGVISPEEAARGDGTAAIEAMCSAATEMAAAFDTYDRRLTAIEDAEEAAEAAAAAA